MSAPLRVRGALRSLKTVNNVMAQQRATVICGPPKNKVSMAEKTGLSLLMVSAVCAPAAYILANIANYRGEQE